MKRIAVFISGSGSNLQAIIDSVNKRDINGEIVLVVSDNDKAYGLQRAKDNNIPCVYLPKSKQTNEYGQLLRDTLSDKAIDLIVLAGFLSILDRDFIASYSHKIINIHPSLIPSFCGLGYYGMKVHEAVFASGVKVTGATTHFVIEEVDSGYIIMQDSIPIENDDTPESIAQKVLRIEHHILVETIRAFCDNRIQIINNRAIIKN